jgi:hypothetical protein
MEETTNREYQSKPLSILPRDWARLERMARARQQSTSGLIRSLILPFVEEFEKVNGLSDLVQK